MANYKLTLSKQTRGGKSELLAKCRVNPKLEFRLKTGVFISPSIFNAGKIQATSKANKAEANKADLALSQFKAEIENLVLVAEEASRKGLFTGSKGKEWKEWIERVLSVKELDATKATFEQIEAALCKAEAEQRAKDKTSIFDYILKYGDAKDVSDKRKDIFRSVARCLYRFQLYTQALDKKEAFVLDYDTMTSDDVEKFRKYLHGEHTLADTPLFITIRAQTNEHFPVKRDFIGKKSKNQIAEILKKLGSVFKWLRETEKTQNNPFANIKIASTKYGSPTFLKEEERDALSTLDLSKRPRLERHRDIFIFQCFVGARYGDLSRMTPANIITEKGVKFLQYIPSKTSKKTETKAVVPIIDKVPLSILEKYRGTDPQGRLFPFPAMNTYNEEVKTILQLADIKREVTIKDPDTGLENNKPICEVVSSHLARRTFINTIYKRVKDPNLIGKMSGHVEGSKAFARYRDIDNNDLIETIKNLRSEPNSQANSQANPQTELAES